MPQALRFTLVDGLRGIAALSVVLFHAVEGNHITALYGSMPHALQSVLFYSYCGVAIFFVLSGFVIAHSLRRDLTIGDAGRFMLKRSLRLDPPYWAAIILTIAIGLVKGTTYSAPQITAHLFYAQDVLGFNAISPIFWTLCLEVQFYIVFAAILLTRSRAIFVAAFVASVPLSLFVIHFGLFTFLWYGFLLGAGCYLSWKNPKASPWFLAYAASLGALGIFRQDVFMLVCVVTALTLFAAARYGKLATLMNWRWLQFLGTVSYSLYLIHNPVIGAVFRVGYRLTERTAATEALWWVVSVLACVGAATVMWWAIERPSVWLSKMFGARHIDAGSMVLTPPSPTT